MPLSHTKREELKGDYYKFYYENKGNFLPAQIADYWLKVLEEELEKQKKELIEKIESEKKDTRIANHVPGGEYAGCATCHKQEDCQCDSFNEGISTAILAIQSHK